MEEKKEENDDMDAPPTPGEVEDEQNRETEEQTEEVTEEEQPEEEISEAEETETTETQEEQPEETAEENKETEEEQPEETVEENKETETTEEETEGLETESPITLEEQEQKLIKDIKETGELIREDINGAPDENVAEMSQAAVEWEKDIGEIVEKDDAAVSEAIKEEVEELKEEIQEKEEFFRKKYIEEIKDEINQVKTEIIDEISEPKPEEIKHIKIEISKIREEVKAIPRSNVIDNDASKLFEELKRRGTLRDVEVRTKAPEKKMMTPQQIINKSLKQDDPTRVPSAWELLQRKKAKEGKK